MKTKLLSLCILHSAYLLIRLTFRAFLLSVPSILLVIFVYCFDPQHLLGFPILSWITCYLSRMELHCSWQSMHILHQLYLRIHLDQQCFQKSWISKSIFDIRWLCLYAVLQTVRMSEQNIFLASLFQNLNELACGNDELPDSYLLPIFNFDL
jgi:hypothetical protein